MKKIATLNKISPVGLGKLTDDYTVTEDINEASGIIVRSADMHDIDFSDNLLAIARAGAGYNNIPIDRCADKGIVVFNAPGANANAVKELVICAMLMCARNVYDAVSWTKTLDKDSTGEIEKGKSQFAGTELKGKTLGVIGLGAIGVLVANQSRSLGMEVVGYDPFLSLKSAHALSNKIPVVKDLDELLAQSDYITIHIPATEDTKGLLDSRRFSQIKPGAVLLNFARDTLVSEEALINALEDGTIRKYVTDFTTPGIIGRENVISTPHLGASTVEAEDNCATMAVEQLMDYIENGNIVNSVNFPACSMGPLNKEAVARVCIFNVNKPSIIGKMTSKIADMDINIRDMTNKSKGDYAYTLIDIDNEISDAQVEELRGVDGIIKVRVIK